LQENGSMLFQFNLISPFFVVPNLSEVFWETVVCLAVKGASSLTPIFQDILMQE